MSLQAIVWSSNDLRILDQLVLPQEHNYVPVKNVRDGWNVIYNMQVRGAPAIAIVGCLSLAAELCAENDAYDTKAELKNAIKEKLEYLVTARPTAVNMRRAAQEMIQLADALEVDSRVGVKEMKQSFVKAAEQMLEKDIADNKAIGDFGAEEIIRTAGGKENLNILTHCNTGSLATAGHGTALGIVRSLHSRKRIGRVYCTETRPYNQGARLTAYELVYEKIPGTLICDSMVAALMRTQQVDAVVVGADRVAANGDTANKIGTYQLAILAQHHGVPFYVAAPRTSIDFDLEDGSGITIETRPSEEMTHVNGQRVAAVGIECWNPAFDVTPAALITGIVTELGVLKPRELRRLKVHE